MALNAPDEIYFANLIMFVKFSFCVNANTKIVVLILQSLNLLLLKCIMTTLANTRSELYYILRYVNILELKRRIVYSISYIRCLSNSINVFMDFK